MKILVFAILSLSTYQKCIALGLISIIRIWNIILSQYLPKKYSSWTEIKKYVPGVYSLSTYQKSIALGHVILYFVNYQAHTRLKIAKIVKIMQNVKK